MIAGAPELKGKVTMSWYLLVAIILLTFTMGGTITKVLDNDGQRMQMKENLEKEIQNVRNEMREQKEFLLGEVDGHRSDENRRYSETVNPRLNDLEDKHK